MAIEQHIMNAAGELDALRSQVESVHLCAIEQAQERIPADEIDIVYKDEEILTIPELRVGGHTNHNGNLIYINLDSDNPPTDEDLKSMIIHELSHAARHKQIPWNSRIGSRVVEEGLACVFEEEVTGRRPIYSSVKLTDESTSKLLAEDKAKKKTEYKWMFGIDGYPKWYGYSYGYYICRQYLDKTNRTAADVIDLPSEEIWNS